MAEGTGAAVDPEAWKPQWLRIFSSSSFIISVVVVWCMALLTIAVLRDRGASVTEICALIGALLLGQATRRGVETVTATRAQSGNT